MGLELKDLVPIYFERSNALESLWGFYITVILGLLAFFATYGGYKSPIGRRLLASAMSLGFLAFALLNLGALLDVSRARAAIRALIVEQHPAEPRQVDRLLIGITPASPASVLATHLASDALVVFWIWILAFRREPPPPSAHVTGGPPPGPSPAQIPAAESASPPFSPPRHPQS